MAAIPLAFIIPALCYMKLEDGGLFTKKKFPAFLLALFGIAVTTWGTVVLIISRVCSKKYTHKTFMPFASSNPLLYIGKQ